MSSIEVASLPATDMITDRDSLVGYSHDEAEWAPYGTPLAVVRPTGAAETQAVVRWCVEHRVPIVPRGAGTGLSGGANAIDGSVIISFERMNAILRIDPVERLAVVQPGVVNDDLRAAAAEHGLWYPPDPASSPWSTIGGNVATNAGGVCCVKYGVTRDYVLGRLGGTQPYGDLGDQPEGALRTDQQTGEVVPGDTLRGLTTQPDQLAGAGDHLEPQDVVAGHAVLDAADAAGVGGDVAADGRPR